MERINRKNILNIILGISGLIIASLAFYIAITIKDIKQISNNIHAKRIELELQYQSGLSLRENIQELVKVRPVINSAEESFVDSQATLEFINDLEIEAEKLGIKQVINIPEIEIEKNKITTSAIQLTLTGQADDIFKFLNVLDKKPYYINVADIQITNSNQPDKTLKNVNAIINGTIYWK